MAISVQDNNNVTVWTKLRSVRDMVVGRAMAKTATNAITSASNVAAMDCSLGDDWTYAGAESTTITPSNIQPNQLVTIIFNGTAGAITITFGSPFHSTGTLALGTDANNFLMASFKGNAAGTALFEVTRTNTIAPITP